MKTVEMKIEQKKERERFTAQLPQNEIEGIYGKEMRKKGLDFEMTQA
jgi:hypothetical protein